MNVETVDFIVVGSARRKRRRGPARRQAASSGRCSRRRGQRPQPLHQMPAATYLYALANPRYDWSYGTLPDPTRANQPTSCRGTAGARGLHLVNRMLCIARTARRLRRLGQDWMPRWDFALSSAWFKRNQKTTKTAKTVYAEQGAADRIEPAGLASSVGGLPAKSWEQRDCRSLTTSGCHRTAWAACQTTQQRGSRLSAAQASYGQRCGAVRSAVRMKAQVTQVLFEGGRPSVWNTGRTDRLGAADGAARGRAGGRGSATPRILMLSRVGRRRVCRHGIPVVHDLAGIGRNRITGSR